MMYPEELRYTKDHEWIRMEDGVCTVGITHYAQDSLGDIVFVELPEVGGSVGAGDVLGTIESVKAVSDLYAPVSGEIKEVNSSLEDSPEVINSDPYGEGWICKIMIGDEGELEGTMDAGRYQAFLEEVEE